MTPNTPGCGRRIFMLGATGTIGRATVRALAAAGHEVVCFNRSASSARSTVATECPTGVSIRTGDICNAESLTKDGFRGETFDVLVSCLASRTGAPHDAWAIDYAAHSRALSVARAAGVTQVVLLSAICVQKPLLAFQQAKLAFERELIASGLIFSIVRPTAFFKSLSGQVTRVQNGKPFLVFGDGTLTSCKPISDQDVAQFIAGCVDNVDRYNQIMPIGGPGAAVTPREQGAHLFALLGREPRYKQVPVALFDLIIATLSALGRVFPPLAAKAELARIGRYYATESMLVWDDAAARYDADATPSFGGDTLMDYQARLLRGDATDDRGAHAVF